MELFQKAMTVKLSHNDKYLTAEDNQESVCQDRDGSSRKAIWAVEFNEGDKHLRLKSCYGRYLTASNAPFLPGSLAKKVLQTLPSRMDSNVNWEPIRDGFSVRLRTPQGHFLRPNGGLPPWRNSVTHDVPRRMGTQEKILWDIEIVDALPKTPALPSTTNLERITSNTAFPTQKAPPALQPFKFAKVRR